MSQALPIEQSAGPSPSSTTTMLLSPISEMSRQMSISLSSKKRSASQLENSTSKATFASLINCVSPPPSPSSAAHPSTSKLLKEALLTTSNIVRSLTPPLAPSLTRGETLVALAKESEPTLPPSLNSFKKAKVSRKSTKPVRNKSSSMGEESNSQEPFTWVSPRLLHSLAASSSSGDAPAPANPFGPDNSQTITTFHFTQNRSENQVTLNGSMVTTAKPFSSLTTLLTKPLPTVNSLSGPTSTVTESNKKDACALPSGDTSSSQATSTLTSGIETLNLETKEKPSQDDSIILLRHLARRPFSPTPYHSPPLMWVGNLCMPKASLMRLDQVLLDPYYLPPNASPAMTMPAHPACSLALSDHLAAWEVANNTFQESMRMDRQFTRAQAKHLPTTPDRTPSSTMTLPTFTRDPPRHAEIFDVPPQPTKSHENKNDA